MSDLEVEVGIEHAASDEPQLDEDPESENREGVASQMGDSGSHDADLNRVTAKDEEMDPEYYHPKVPLRISKPWLFETRKPTTDPPDVNYRKLICDDQEYLDRLFKDENLHFKERCLRYEEQDVWLQFKIFRDYQMWVERMLKDATASEDDTRRDFLEGLLKVVKEDFHEVFEELDGLWKAMDHREREHASKALGIPLDAKEWTTEDKRIYAFSDEKLWVRGWPGRPDLRKELEELERAAAANLHSENEQKEDHESNCFTSDNKENALRAQIAESEDALPISPEAQRSSDTVTDEDEERSETEIGSHGIEPQSPSLSKTQPPLQRGTFYYRLFVGLLIALLGNEVVKQKLRL